MTGELRCPHDLLPGQCSWCRPRSAPKVARAEMSKVAEYASQCPDCWGRIDPGDVIGYSGGEWVCSDCVDVDPPDVGSLR